ncbi:hypothetical protein [Verrucomicrobium sp. BvORR106]|uniref:metal-dependent hydrolase n=1 Tax=Verrucomicrobium sp. BvORR106 TaxID=1403819 RepID=UPI002240F32C|nr:hypothetical protein [Verrucomicrobium sp. BvORR106]
MPTCSISTSLIEGGISITITGPTCRSFGWRLLGATLLLALLLRSRALALAASSFVGGVFLHLLLDTPFAGIRWLYPLSDHSYYLVTVPATRSWWVWSFVFHWTFLFEIAICIAALVVFIIRRRRS